jgi:trimeric autotransporter adhesin
MKPIETAYVNALLADASYVVGLSPRINLEDELKTRMTPSQAKFIAANFEVVNSVETLGGFNGSTGFDATVWRGKAGSDYAGQVYVSTRGTQGGQDILDDISLATRGIPHQQIADMVNWWLKNTASAGRTDVKQIKVTTTVVPLIGAVYTFELDVATTGTGVLEGLPPITSVNGHSLGGYLATGFTQLFGAAFAVESVNTFNSAGFSNVASLNIDYEYNNIASLIGGGMGLGFAEVAAKQKNYYGENGVELTTNSLADFRLPGFSQYGARQGLYQEDGLGVDPIANHYMYKQTDLLALGAALERLDNTITFTQLNEFIKAGSNDMKASYEGVLDALRKVLNGPNVQTLTPADVSNSIEPRPTYHTTLAELQANQIFKDLTGKLKITASNSDLGAIARIDFGAFIALKDLSSIYISGIDAAAHAQLKSIWQANRADDYTAWEADKEPAIPTTFSDEWIADRAIMLGLVIKRNVEDVTATLTNGNEDVWYRDENSKTDIRLDTSILFPNGDDVRRRVYFGDDLDNTRNGGDKEDHLYGGRNRGEIGVRVKFP